MLLDRLAAKKQAMRVCESILHKGFDAGMSPEAMITQMEQAIADLNDQDRENVINIMIEVLNNLVNHDLS